MLQDVTICGLGCFHEEQDISPTRQFTERIEDVRFGNVYSSKSKFDSGEQETGMGSVMAPEKRVRANYIPAT